MPDAGRTHGPPATKKQAAVTTGSAGATGIPRAMALRLIRALPWCTGLVSHHPPGLVTPGVDSSVGESGPHDSAVRGTSHVRQCNRVLLIPRPTPVTIV
jgi:hypothetical protein